MKVELPNLHAPGPRPAASEVWASSYDTVLITVIDWLTSPGFKTLPPDTVIHLTLEKIPSSEAPDG